MVQPDSGYDPTDAKQKLEELDALLPKVQVPAHKEKFVKVQDYLKKNNSLIKSVMEAQEKALKEGGQSADKSTLQHCAEMIKELNENLTQVYDIYNHLSDS